MKQIYKLRFSKEAQWLEILEQINKAEPSILEGKPVKVNPTSQPDYDPETEDKPDRVPIEGFHIDVILEDGALVNDYIVEVDRPTHNFGAPYPLAIKI